MKKLVALLIITTSVVTPKIAFANVNKCFFSTEPQVFIKEIDTASICLKIKDGKNVFTLYRADQQQLIEIKEIGYGVKLVTVIGNMNSGIESAGFFLDGRKFVKWFVLPPNIPLMEKCRKDIGILLDTMELSNAKPKIQIFNNWYIIVKKLRILFRYHGHK